MGAAWAANYQANLDAQRAAPQFDPVWGIFDLKTPEGWTDFQVASAWGKDWRTNPDPNIRISGGQAMYDALYGGNVDFFTAQAAQASDPATLARQAARTAATQARKAAKRGTTMPDTITAQDASQVPWGHDATATPNQNDSVMVGSPLPATMATTTYTPPPQVVVTASTSVAGGAGVSGLGRGTGRVGHRAARIAATQPAPRVPATSSSTAPQISPATPVGLLQHKPIAGGPPMWIILAAIAAVVVLGKH